MVSSSLLTIVVLSLAAYTAEATFNFTTCPAYWEMQKPKYAETFDINKLVGHYYELALHDYTQYPTCPKPSCIQSHKIFMDVGDGK